MRDDAKLADGQVTLMPEEAVPGARSTISLDGEWRFVPDPDRRYDPSSVPEGRSIVVPGCWEAQLEQPFGIVNAWYTCQLRIPAEWDGSRVLIHFGAVMYRCTVWLNEERLGAHEGGYTPFMLEAQQAVRWGASNRLAVQVENPVNALKEYPAFSAEGIRAAERSSPDLPISEIPHGKQTWYSSQSGIWQSVHAIRVGRSNLGSVRVLPNVGRESAAVRWRLHGSVNDPDLMLRLVVTAPDGEVVSTTIDPVDGHAAGETRVDVPRPALWDLDTPNLYRLEAMLSDGSVEQDRITVRFGMREVSTKDGKVSLNGRPLFLLGALDQDLYPDTISTSPSRKFLDEHFRQARELGMNLLRCHIKVPDPAYLDAADEAGILLWCELPNWSRFSPGSAARGRSTLEEMVTAMGNHPSIVIWTIINEDWGTNLRYEARDRRWLSGTYEWMKRVDPGRLVVDNSACETSETPNFHVQSDLADFHIYVSADGSSRWRAKVADFASRPAWLWSPYGDAQPRGDEPLVLSEFGGWGLPRLDRLLEHFGDEPWWFSTGQGFCRPAGVHERFIRYGLDRIWPTIDDLAEATQALQFDGLQSQIAELRRHESIAGYVVTELTDAYWEANGLLDVARGPKVYGSRFGEINASETILFFPERQDVWGGSHIVGVMVLSSYSQGEVRAGFVRWRLEVGGIAQEEGEIPVADWPRNGVLDFGRFEIPVPMVTEACDARLLIAATDDSGKGRARNELRFTLLPRLTATGHTSRRVAVHDPLEIWGLQDRITSLGHRVTGLRDAEVLVTSDLSPEIVEYAEGGGRVVVLVRSRDALPDAVRLRRSVSVQHRQLAHPDRPGRSSPWNGDWVSTYSWILPGTIAGVPRRAPLDGAYAEVTPDHVLLGYDPAAAGEEVTAGMFVGWVHEPAALLWTFAQGAGTLALTTFRLAPESGPLASTMLDGLVQKMAHAPGS